MYIRKPSAAEFYGMLAGRRITGNREIFYNTLQIQVLYF